MQVVVVQGVVVQVVVVQGVVVQGMVVQVVVVQVVVVRNGSSRSSMNSGPLHGRAAAMLFVERLC
jgi:hypothetical protein